MRIAGLAALAGLCVVVLFPAAGWSQYDDEETGTSKFNIRLGYARLIGADDRQTAGKTWFTEVVTYDYKRDDEGRALTQIELGMSEPSQSTTASTVFAAASQVWWKDAGKGQSWFGGVGIGAYRMKFIGDKTLKAGAQVFGGRTFGGAYFVELRATILPSWTASNDFASVGLNLSSYTLSIGTTRLF